MFHRHTNIHCRQHCENVGLKRRNQQLQNVHKQHKDNGNGRNQHALEYEYQRNETQYDNVARGNVGEQSNH